MKFAIDDCTEVIRLMPERANAHRLFGEIYEKAGQWVKAEPDLAKAKGLESRRS